ncbi:helix-turn-helix transcriptional regulator [Microbacterium hominis]|uniref:WYL domain-containing protein n=1 Tax=Microbacterium hominis TaxID=162426 RepID=A0A7D4UGF2_9MICO|nr:WYL domain-containing protein [Microbacterium hominis]QKJ19549.1 WYL domain-containing protein [Microbacterium hominis]
MSPMPSMAVDRAALYLQLVPYLIGKGEVSLAEAADAFAVEPEQMRGMVEKITILGRPGEAGFYQMPNDLFDIDWDLLDTQDLIVITNTVGLERVPRLTAREVAALLAGLQLARSIPGVGDSALYEGLLAKLSRGGSGTPAEVIVAPGPVDHVRITVAEALASGVAVSFTYKAPDAAPTTRTVDPVKVNVASGQWYLQGWCHLRQAMRTFHLDRVSDIALTDIPITHAQEQVPAWFADRDRGAVARIRFPRDVAPLLGEFLDGATIEEDGAFAVATMRMPDETALRRLAARRGGLVEILEPASARQAAAEWARAALEQYR